MVLSIQTGERFEVGVGVGEEPAEVGQSGRQAGHGLGSAGADLAFQVGNKRGA